MITRAPSTRLYSSRSAHVALLMLILGILGEILVLLPSLMFGSVFSGKPSCSLSGAGRAGDGSRDELQLPDGSAGRGDAFAHCACALAL